MRPKTLEDFTGNKEAVERIKLKIVSSQKNNKSFPHILLAGSSGVGKSTLAEIISNELSAGFIYINSTTINKPTMFRRQIGEAANLAASQGRCIVLLDEAHALPKKVQDNLLSLLEYPAVLCTQGIAYCDRKRKFIKDETAIYKEDLPENVSFIFATTHLGNLSDALLNRLFRVEMSDYSHEELAQIAKNIIKDLSDDASKQVGGAARSARDVNKICENIRDICAVRGRKIDPEIIEKAIKYSGYEKYGLTKNELRYIRYLGEVDQSSLANLSSFLNLSDKEVKEKIEPFLIRRKLVYKDTKGRRLTEKGYKLYERI